MGGLEHPEIQGVQALDLDSSINCSGKTSGEKTITWFNYFSIEKNQVQAKELLAPFRKESQKEWAYPNTSSISTIEFDPPRGSIYRDLYINRTIQDSRYIPTTENGLVIRKKFLKYYLEQRLEEYLALGGLQELIERRTLFIQGYKLPDPFYWDLWGNLEHLSVVYLYPQVAIL